MLILFTSNLQKLSLFIVTLVHFNSGEIYFFTRAISLLSDIIFYGPMTEGNHKVILIFEVYARVIT